MSRHRPKRPALYSDRLMFGATKRRPKDSSRPALESPKPDKSGPPLGLGFDDPVPPEDADEADLYGGDPEYVWGTAAAIREEWDDDRWRDGLTGWTALRGLIFGVGIPGREDTDE